jgi:Flp pilus assembly protein TadD
MAPDKLYVALVADGQVKIEAGQVGDAVAELERAARLLPDRTEAWALLAQLVSLAQAWVAPE